MQHIRGVNTMTKKLTRSLTNRKLAGVCGGLAEYFNVDADLVRLVTALLILCAGLSVWVYIIAAIIIPEETIEYYNNTSETETSESTEE